MKKIILFVVTICLLTSSVIVSNATENDKMQVVKNLAKVYVENEIKTKNNNDIVANSYGKSIYWKEVRSRAEIYKLFSQYQSLSDEDIYKSALSKIASEKYESNYLRNIGQSVSDLEIRTMVEHMKKNEEKLSFDESPAKQYIQFAGIDAKQYWGIIQYEETKRYLTHLKYLELTNQSENNLTNRQAINNNSDEIEIFSTFWSRLNEEVK